MILGCLVKKINTFVVGLFIFLLNQAGEFNVLIDWNTLSKVF